MDGGPVATNQTRLTRIPRSYYLLAIALDDGENAEEMVALRRYIPSIFLPQRWTAKHQDCACRNSELP